MLSTKIITAFRLRNFTLARLHSSTLIPTCWPISSTGTLAEFRACRMCHVTLMNEDTDSLSVSLLSSSKLSPSLILSKAGSRFLIQLSLFYSFGASVSIVSCRPYVLCQRPNLPPNLHFEVLDKY